MRPKLLSGMAVLKSRKIVMTGKMSVIPMASTKVETSRMKRIRVVLRGCSFRVDLKSESVFGV